MHREREQADGAKIARRAEAHCDARVVALAFSASDVEALKKLRDLRV
jgi:hypothetical protein